MSHNCTVFDAKRAWFTFYELSDITFHLAKARFWLNHCGIVYYVTLGIMTLGIVLLGVMTYNPLKNEQISIVATFTMPKSNGNKDQASLSLTVFFKMPTLFAWRVPLWVFWDRLVITTTFSIILLLRRAMSCIYVMMTFHSAALGILGLYEL